MKHVIGLLLLTGLLLGPPAALANEPMQPRVGLVLSGGGAKGAAHVGVIKVLEELGVRVDVVVGTSMGAIVGGLYASGLTGDELDTAIDSIDWVDIFDDDPPRVERSFRRKQDDSEVLIRYRLGLKDGSLRLPSGLIIGQKLGLALRRLAARAPGNANFDDLPRRYRAVAADLIEGEPVVIGAGSLARAMHASMSVPGVFPPLEYDGRLLVDGGVVNNVPIDVARSLGADRLIVVTLLSKPVARHELYDAVRVAEQSISLMIDRETRRQLATLAPGDIVINPELGDLGSTDFLRSREAIALGEVAARTQLDALAALAGQQNRQGEEKVLAAGDGVATQGQRTASAGFAPNDTIRAIRIENATPLDDAVLSAQMTLHPGDELNLLQLEQDISRIYGLGYFETVDYRLDRRAGGTDVVVVARERQIGLSTLRFGLTLESDFDGDSAFNFITEYQVLGVNARGGEWRSALALGEAVLIASEFYQPLDHAQRWFVDGRAIYSETSRGVFDGGRRLSEFRVRQAVASFDVGRAFSTCCELRTGVRFGVGESRVETGSPTLRGGSFQVGSFTASAGYDTLDNPRFPRHGAAWRLQYDNALDAFGASDPSQRLEFGGAVVRSLGSHTVLLRTEISADLDDDDGTNVQSLFSLGGLFSLSGLARDEIADENSLLGSVIYYQRLRRLGGLEVPVPLYVGGSLEYGGVYEDLGDVGGERDIFAGSLFLGADTALGPFYFALGQAEGGRRSLYLFLGQTF